MNIQFTKAVASGNDFIILDNIDNKFEKSLEDFNAFAEFSCRRKYSVGSDGLLVLESSDKADFKMRIFNPDGSEVTMCGNGIRCSALYAHEKGRCGESMKIETLAGILEAQVNGDLIKLKMTDPKGIKLNRNIGVGKKVVHLHSVNTGVPHAVHFVENIALYPVNEIGRKVRYHKVFEPEGTNADFVEIRDKNTIAIRTYERGVEDETFACGTGVVASAIISHLVNNIEPPVNAITQGKEVLKVYFRRDKNVFKDIYLEGKASIAFEGGLDYV